MMKNKFMLVLFLFCLVIMPALVLNSMHVNGTNCFRLTMPTHAEIYSESNQATNVVAKVQPNDVIYFCGDK